MSMLVSFVLSFFPRDVLDEILNLIGSVSEGFPSYFFIVSIYLTDKGDVRASDMAASNTFEIRASDWLMLNRDYSFSTSQANANK